jgi:SAM-dependent methyltransferase
MTTWTDETAEWYAEKYGEYPTNHLAVDMLELAPDAVVLDIGCGTAAALRHAASKVTSGRLLGVDPVPRMVEIARERVASHPAAGRIELHVAPADALPFDDGTIDVVLAFDSYDHWAPPTARGPRRSPARAGARRPLRGREGRQRPVRGLGRQGLRRRARGSRVHRLRRKDGRRGRGVLRDVDGARERRGDVRPLGPERCS